VARLLAGADLADDRDLRARRKREVILGREVEQEREEAAHVEEQEPGGGPSTRPGHGDESYCRAAGTSTTNSISYRTMTVQ